MNVLSFSNFYQTHGTAQSLGSHIQDIRTGTYQDLVLQIRATSDGSQRLLKTKLPSFAPSLSAGTRKLSEGTNATGIVQFDVDEPVTRIDYEALAASVRSIPHLCYCFRSPGGKLKFGMLTDFAISAGDSPDVTKQRFKQAYCLTKSYVGEFIDVEFDDSSERIGQLCSLSFDPDAFYDPACMPLTINDSCVAPSQTREEYAYSADPDRIAEMLKFVPPTLGWQDRLPVNMAVVGELGQQGIPMLLSHWEASDFRKLGRDLWSLLPVAKPGFVGNLKKIAKSYGYQELSPQTRRRQKALASSHVFPEMVDAKLASRILDQHLTDFVANRKSKVIRISCGFGKTDMVFDIISHLGWQTKILILVPSHSLGIEAEQRLKAKVRGVAQQQGAGTFRPIIQHIWGKKAKLPDGRWMCEDAFIRETQNVISKKVCTDLCLYGGDCRYTHQFEGFANIRICSNLEYFNEQPAYWNGTRAVGDTIEPRSSGWTPDFIIIDEACFISELEDIGPNSRWSSLTTIVASCLHGRSLVDSVLNAKRAVIDDMTMRNSRLQQNGYKKQPGELILEECYKLVMNRVSATQFQETISFHDSRIWLHRFRRPAARYSGIPTLMLDATIDPEIAQAIFPKFEFVNLTVRPNDASKVFQCQNASFSKTSLMDSKRLQKVVKHVRDVASRYKKDGKRVGLITYKTVSGLVIESTFAAWLADAVGADCYEHFGNLLGTNKFEDVDCLLVVGRHRIPDDFLERYGRAIFGEAIDASFEYRDVPVRMSSGSAMSLNHRVYDDPRLVAIYRQFCTAETIQAIGRARLIHGKPKDVYVYSNESLGSDVAITSFFDFDHGDFTDDIEISDDLRFLENVPRELKKLGITEHHIKNKRERITEWLAEAGFDRLRVSYRNRQYKQVEKEFFSRDNDALAAFLGSCLEIVRVDRTENPVTT